ncbi:MAG: phosphate/phosphite/phosphonate ABC transporter substrate-binding protein [Chloroflexi bacterium]|nr:phosphate/phosphite/phosphonate ABC transporter substrate-binding protein [Chloroflexota bacterium]
MKPVLVGAVVYDPKVVTIWEIIANFFSAQGCPMDTVFYNNYALQVDALVNGHIQVAWNSPLAWLDTLRLTDGRCRAIAMRDTDRDRVSHLLVRSDSGISKPEDLQGRTLATGAKDSPQATLIPLNLMQDHGLTPERDFRVKRFDVLVGKHGDHVGGELQALQSLLSGESDSCAALDMNWERWSSDGTADPRQVKVLATTPRFDHCNFTVLESFPQEDEDRWKEVLFRMRYDNPDHREMMDMEGLKEWLPGRTSGYEELSEGADRQRYFTGGGR